MVFYVAFFSFLGEVCAWFKEFSQPQGPGAAEPGVLSSGKGSWCPGCADRCVLCHLVVGAGPCRHPNLGALCNLASHFHLTSLSPLFVLPFSECFLSSFYVSSPVPPLGAKLRVRSGPAYQELLGQLLFFLLREPHALNPLLQVPGKESVYTAENYRDVWVRADLQGHIYPNSAGKDTSSLVCSQPHIRQSPLHVTDSRFSLQENSVAMQHFEVVIINLF